MRSQTMSKISKTTNRGGKKEEKTHQRRITELRICEKVEVAVLDSPSLIARKVSVDVKLNSNTKELSRKHEVAQ